MARYEKTVMVGDDLQYGYLAGMNASMDTIMVHTTVTPSNSLLRIYKKQPTHEFVGGVENNLDSKHDLISKVSTL
ncbi:HAD hydrolase-like protein [Anaerobacillus sp. HL2]|nr:HAD hydrolase-like protein [Anaerobacillus sp. HL2]